MFASIYRAIHNRAMRLSLGSDHLKLGRLKGNIGNQNYVLPDNHELGIYRSVVVYCLQFETVITSARFR